jgi:group I intron endonuclease
MIFIYLIFNTVNGTLYVGISGNPTARWWKHQYDAKSQNPTAEKFAIHRAIAKYGADKFIFKVVEEVDTWTNAQSKERQWIKELKENGFRLYNETEGGGGSVGRKMTPLVKETLLKCRRKLDNASIQEIRDLYRTDNYTQTALAKQFGISLTQIHRIVREKSWGNKGHDAVLTKKNITEDRVIEIRRLYATNEYTQVELANIFGISLAQINRIVNGKRWKNVL